MENVGKKKLDMQKLLAPAALVILYIVFSIFGNNFLTLDTVKNILESSYYIGFMAFGVTFIIITGGIDLSLGTVMMCAALLGGYAFKQGWPLVLAIVLTLFVGIAFGFANGVLIAKLKLPPFIATLGTQMMAAGLGSIITKVQSQTWPTATPAVGPAPPRPPPPRRSRRLVQEGLHPCGAVRRQGLPGRRVLAARLLHHRSADPA